MTAHEEFFKRGLDNHLADFRDIHAQRQSQKNPEPTEAGRKKGSGFTKWGELFHYYKQQQTRMQVLQLLF